MKFDLTILERSAATLEHYAGVFEGRAQKYYAENKRPEGDGQMLLSKERAEEAESIRAALRILKVKVKRGAFIAPSLEELTAHAAEHFPRWPAADIRAWFNHFESVGWVVGRGKPMVDWKRAAANGFRNWEEKNPKQATAPKHGDPEGWREFLAETEKPYIAYDRAIDFMKSAFERWKRNQ